MGEHPPYIYVGTIVAGLSESSKTRRRRNCCLFLHLYEFHTHKNKTGSLEEIRHSITQRTWFR